ncbi:phytoene desaturase [Sphingobacteriales bacterium UPWRP_1]|nr:phytoene dehydrogenase [Sphingobacteriales bacterium TSM_CSM]PSJ76786.1 phytoene desaturase [Sphingobacteriales bacterium UPWRP_1]
MEKTAGIIGAGVAGLAAAIRLAVRGFKVTVFEANSYPGGKLSSIEQDGYRFDAGPSLFTMPFLVDELLNLTGKNTTDYFAYTRLPVICKYYFEDGTQINGYADARKFAVEVQQKTGVAAEKVYRHLQKSEQLYRLTSKVFLENSLHKIQTYLLPETLKAIPQLYKLNMFSSMNNANKRNFKNNKVTQLFNRFATYNGSNPYRAPATLNIIPHLEHNIGAYFPLGGMHSITQTLYRLAAEEGVQFCFNTPVTEIVVQNGKAVGIKTGEENYHHFDMVISNMDVWHTYYRLLPAQKKPMHILNRPKSSSALIFYWGIGASFPQLDLHNIFFSNDYRKEFGHIFELNSMYHDPTVYVNISSKYHFSDAPPGCENWFVMINVPPDKGQNWQNWIPEARNNILKKLSRLLQTDVAALIKTEAILDPRSIESRTASHMGALYGSNSNSIFSAFFRHANFSSNIKNLYFCGGSVHPGGGIPLSLLSAKIVDHLIKN